METEPHPQDEPLDIPALHQALIDSLKEAGSIQSEQVEAAFRAVPRHLFLPNYDVKEAYEDKALITKQDENEAPISSSSQPTIMATMLEQLDLRPGHLVLEIGAGTGYNAALMAQIVGKSGHVVTVDIDEDIVAKARENLSNTGFDQVQVICADGAYGYPDSAPYDRIILTVGAGEVFPAWIEQLKIDGRIVLPLVIRSGQRSVAFERTVDGLKSASVQNCAFMLMRGEFTQSNASLTLDDGIQLWSDQALDVDTTKATLSNSYRELDANLPYDSTFWGIISWLEIREPRFIRLAINNQSVEDKTRPELQGARINYFSAGIAEGERVTFLTLSPYQRAPSEDTDKNQLPFILHIRSYGPDDALAYQLIAYLNEWSASGKPDFVDDLHISVYPLGIDISASANAIIMRRKWMQYVLESIPTTPKPLPS